MKKDKQKGFQGPKLLRSIMAATSGFGQALKTEQNLRIDLVGMILVGGLGWWLKIDPIEWLMVIFCIGGIIAMEMMNTGLEYLADVVRDEGKLSYKATKLPRDMAAAAVLVSLITALAVGGAIFVPKLLALFG